MEQGAYDVKYPGLDDTIFRALRCLRASAVMRLLCKSMAPVAAAINPSELHLKLFSVPARQSVPLPTVTEAEEIEDEHEHSEERCAWVPMPTPTLADEDPLTSLAARTGAALGVQMAVAAAMREGCGCCARNLGIFVRSLDEH